MTAYKLFSWKRFLTLTLIASSLSGCTEVRKVFSIFFNKQGSLNTNGFEVSEMSSGDGVTCSLMGDKTLRCLGTGLNGDLGRFHGAQNNNLKDIKQIALGNGFSCAIIGEKSELKCFGLNNKSYCILNKEYPKDERESLASKIIEELQSK